MSALESRAVLDTSPSLAVGWQAEGSIGLSAVAIAKIRRYSVHAKCAFFFASKMTFEPICRAHA